jgi:hypothetical protein
LRPRFPGPCPGTLGVAVELLGAVNFEAAESGIGLFGPVPGRLASIVVVLFGPVPGRLASFGPVLPVRLASFVIVLSGPVTLRVALFVIVLFALAALGVVGAPRARLRGPVSLPCARICCCLGTEVTALGRGAF